MWPGRSPAGSGSSASTTTTTAARVARRASTAARSSNALRDAGSYLLPSGHAYRCTFCAGSCDLRCATFVGDSVAQNLPGQLAGAVIELMTNGNGATTYRDGYVAEVARQVHAAGGVVIADEVATGFGRTGSWFASDHEGIVPDVDGPRQGDGQRLPGDGDRRPRRARRGARRLVPEHQLRRQPDGLRGRVRRARRDAAPRISSATAPSSGAAPWRR